MEPHYGNVLEQPEDFERVLNALADPRLGVCVDTGHFHAAHVKDHCGSVSVGIGRGEIDLPAEIT